MDFNKKYSGYISRHKWLILILVIILPIMFYYKIQTLKAMKFFERRAKIASALLAKDVKELEELVGKIDNHGRNGVTEKELTRIVLLLAETRKDKYKEIFIRAILAPVNLECRLATEEALMSMFDPEVESCFLRVLENMEITKFEREKLVEFLNKHGSENSIKRLQELENIPILPVKK